MNHKLLPLEQLFYLTNYNLNKNILTFKHLQTHLVAYSAVAVVALHIQLYTYTCGNKINNNDEWTHFFRKIYLSHFIRNSCERVAKGLCVRGELETEQTATYWPQVPLSLAALLSCSVRLLNRRSRGPSPLWELVLSTASYLQLTRTVCRTGLYHCLTSTCFLWALHLHPIQPVHGQGYILISSTGCICFSIDGWAEGQYVTAVTIHRLHLCRRVSHLCQVSWIWRLTICWWSSSSAGALRNAEYLFITITPRSTLAQSDSTW